MPGYGTAGATSKKYLSNGNGLIEFQLYFGRFSKIPVPHGRAPVIFAEHAELALESELLPGVPAADEERAELRNSDIPHSLGFSSSGLI